MGRLSARVSISELIQIQTSCVIFYLNDIMLKNPQTLIKMNTINTLDTSVDFDLYPDAIFIPFRDRYDNLNELFDSLSWFDGQIILLHSIDSDLIKIKSKANRKIKLLDCFNFAIVDDIRSLDTFKKTSTIQNIEGWDLPIKRNFALLHSIQKGFEKILLVDDDINGITPQIISMGTKALHSNNIAGCLIESYPDTSVIGHIEQKYGEKYYPFLSGSFLFIKPRITEGFFPLIYNEDWLFMIPSINNKSITAISSIKQKPYDPFDNLNRVKLQEFGEIIANGLFELITQSKYLERFNLSFWNNYINYRRTYVNELLSQSNAKMISFINESLQLSRNISPSMCVDFIQMWEKDLITFDKIKKNAA